MRVKSRTKTIEREEFKLRFDALVDNIERVIKGKREAIRMVLVAMLAEGHVLLEDMPGTGKTMLARAIAQSVDCDQNRIQCTPDLLPSDITGSPILDRTSGDFVFRAGPIFANVFLGDEINRATPKTQSALFEAMAERTVTVDGITHPLPAPFFMIATSNPVELAGTFPLPEAQLDRFLFKLSLGYADHDAELAVLLANQRSEAIASLEAVTSPAELLAMIEWTKGIEISREVLGYIVAICQATRSEPSLLISASSRASLALMRAARVLAAAQGREDVYPDDVKKVLGPVLSHRLVLTADATLRDETVDKVIERIVGRIRPPMADETAA